MAGPLWRGVVVLHRGLQETTRRASTAPRRAACLPPGGPSVSAAKRDRGGKGAFRA